jgi:hypothetical protein
VPIAAPPGWGGPVAAPPPTRSALPPPPVLAAPGIPAIPGPYRSPPQRSLAEMANQQLRRDRKDPLAQGVQDAGRDDCIHGSDKPGAVGGLLNAPVVVARMLADKCAK